ncbi:MAG: hypothetical protein KC478_08960 [Bacteriovoracaceae bacterium]|nr:hypothetical protein [Bacteriovoracaceae bacterium]
MKLSIEKIRLDLRVTWKISRNESLYKSNFIVRLVIGQDTTLGEVAPNIRYGETPELIEQQFNSLPDFSNPQELLDGCSTLEICHSLKCALVCAAVDMIAKKSGMSIETFLGVKRLEKLPTSMSIPIMEEELLTKYIDDIKRFKFIKIKVNEQNAISFTSKITSMTDRPIRIDANEAFSDTDSFYKFIESIENFNIQFIEQPFKASDRALYREVKGECPFEIMADESIEDSADFDELKLMFDSVNIKLMKTGGYLKALELIEKAKASGMKVMLGCMIESSVGISNALRLASLADYLDLDGSLLIKNDPFNLILEDDGLISLKRD